MSSVDDNHPNGSSVDSEASYSSEEDSDKLLTGEKEGDLPQVTILKGSSEAVNKNGSTFKNVTEETTVQDGSLPFNDPENSKINKDPSFVPRDSKYFLHDDRNNDNFETAVDCEEADDGFWEHDLFDVQSQVPKSSLEIIDLYGLDIRTLDYSDFEVMNPIEFSGRKAGRRRRRNFKMPDGDVNKQNEHRSRKSQSNFIKKTSQGKGSNSESEIHEAESKSFSRRSRRPNKWTGKRNNQHAEPSADLRPNLILVKDESSYDDKTESANKEETANATAINSDADCRTEAAASRVVAASSEALWDGEVESKSEKASAAAEGTFEKNRGNVFKKSQSKLPCSSYNSDFCEERKQYKHVGRNYDEFSPRGGPSFSGEVESKSEKASGAAEGTFEKNRGNVFKKSQSKLPCSSYNSDFCEERKQYKQVDRNYDKFSPRGGPSFSVHNETSKVSDHKHAASKEEIPFKSSSFEPKKPSFHEPATASYRKTNGTNYAPPSSPLYGQAAGSSHSEPENASNPEPASNVSSKSRIFHSTKSLYRNNSVRPNSADSSKTLTDLSSEIESISLSSQTKKFEKSSQGPGAKPAHSSNSKDLKAFKGECSSEVLREDDVQHNYKNFTYGCNKMSASSLSIMSEERIMQPTKEEVQKRQTIFNRAAEEQRFSSNLIADKWCSTHSLSRALKDSSRELPRRPTKVPSPTALASPPKDDTSENILLVHGSDSCSTATPSRVPEAVQQVAGSFSGAHEVPHSVPVYQTVECPYHNHHLPNIGYDDLLIGNYREVIAPPSPPYPSELLIYNDPAPPQMFVDSAMLPSYSPASSPTLFQTAYQMPAVPQRNFRVYIPNPVYGPEISYRPELRPLGRGRRILQHHSSVPNYTVTHALPTPSVRYPVDTHNFDMMASPVRGATANDLPAQVNAHEYVLKNAKNNCSDSMANDSYYNYAAPQPSTGQHHVPAEPHNFDGMASPVRGATADDLLAEVNAREFFLKFAKNNSLDSGSYCNYAVSQPPSGQHCVLAEPPNFDVRAAPVHGGTADDLLAQVHAREFLLKLSKNNSLEPPNFDVRAAPVHGGTADDLLAQEHAREFLVKLSKNNSLDPTTNNNYAAPQPSTGQHYVPAEPPNFNMLASPVRGGTADDLLAQVHAREFLLKLAKNNRSDYSATENYASPQPSTGQHCVFADTHNFDMMASPVHGATANDLPAQVNAHEYDLKNAKNNCSDFTANDSYCNFSAPQTSTGQQYVPSGGVTAPEAGTVKPNNPKRYSFQRMQKCFHK